MMATLPLYRSPKRKRDALDSEYHSPSASPTSTISIASLQETRLREEDELGQYSPRAAVAGRMKDLAIRESSLHSEVESVGPATGNFFQSEYTTTASDYEDSPEDSNLDQTNEQSNNDDKHQNGVQPPTCASIEEINATVVFHKKVKPLPAKSRNRRPSPPPSSDIGENSLTWSDSEITGHNPTDPNDDGYGINGIGFRPTAATAWARSQKRQRQVADWKNREAREARERRRERRDTVNKGIMHDVPEGVVQKKVKFDLDTDND